MRIDLDSLATTFKDVEFFLVCLNPASPAVFEGGSFALLETHTSDSYWSVTSIAPQSGQGLVSVTKDEMVLFRGYDADLGVHSYSGLAVKERISDPANLKNGVFAYIRVEKASASALVKSDPLGVAPFYYRRLPDGGYMFASHPRLLLLEQDGVNLIGWMSMMQNGFCYGEQSFYKNIHRVPAGMEFTVNPGKLEMRAWFENANLPVGDQKIDDDAFQNVENAYAESMEKLLALGESRTLPFSSGYDSRRFFATLLEKKKEFTAVTCQTFQRKKGRYYNIDGLFAPQIAAKFGVDCVRLNTSQLDEYKTDSYRRMSLIGTETFMHGWSMPFMDWLAKQPMSIVFDGLAGDTLGNSGYEFEGLHESAKKDIDILMKETVENKKFDHLSSLFPVEAEFKRKYRAYLESYPKNLNGAELAFLQGRTRRGISPWITMMHPPGQVVVFPYCDMRFVTATLQYDPAEKYKWFFQKECLKRSYPNYFDFPGSRNIPAEIEPIPKEQSDAIERQAQEFVYGDNSAVFGALKYLSLQNKILLILSTLFHPLRKRRNWLFLPLLLLVKTHQAQNPFVKWSK